MLLLSAAQASNVSPEKHTTQSLGQLFKIVIYPKDGKKIIGQYHDWVIHIEDAKGKTVDNARMAISGGMVTHGHGLPSKPQVTSYLGKGNYLIEGVLFNMAGDWTLQFVIWTPTHRDRARFDFGVAF